MTSASSASPFHTAATWPRRSSSEGGPGPLLPSDTSRAVWSSEARLSAKTTASEMAEEPSMCVPVAQSSSVSATAGGDGSTWMKPSSSLGFDSEGLASSRDATLCARSSSHSPSPACPDAPTRSSSRATRRRASASEGRGLRPRDSSSAHSRLSAAASPTASASMRRRSLVTSAAKWRSPTDADCASSRSSWTSLPGRIHSCLDGDPWDSSAPSAAAGRAPGRSGDAGDDAARRQEFCTIRCPTSSCTRESSRRTSSSARSPRSVRCAISARPRRPASLAFSSSQRMPALAEWSTIAAWPLSNLRSSAVHCMSCRPGSCCFAAAPRYAALASVPGP
mmetsp:Transcript_7435/g.23461  ORF Transcript_7435/g.23461 Transcript_7435/m.23461 type:complete len:336 (+) Transcript_7435:328-1335(+)